MELMLRDSLNKQISRIIIICTDCIIWYSWWTHSNIATSLPCQSIIVLCLCVSSDRIRARSWIPVFFQFEINYLKKRCNFQIVFEEKIREQYQVVIEKRHQVNESIQWLKHFQSDFLAQRHLLPIYKQQISLPFRLSLILFRSVSMFAKIIIKVSQ